MPEFLRNAFESLAVTAWLFIPCCLLALALAAQACRETLQDVLQGKASAKAFLAVLILGLALRAGWIALTQPAPISDYIDYWQEALRITGGNWSFPNIDKHPGIIMLMTACFKLFGANPWGIWGMNLVFSGLSLVLLYRVGLLLAGPWGALAAALIAAFQPQLIAYTALFASELPTLFFYLLLTWCALRFRPGNNNLLYWAALGCVLYAAVLTRSTSLLFLGLIPLTRLAFRQEALKKELARCAIFGLTACLLLSTWLYHQNLLTGKTQLFWGSEIWLVSTTHYKTGGRLVNPWALPDLGEKIQARTEKLTGIKNRLVALETMKEWAMPIIRQNPWRYVKEGRTRLRHILWTTSETGIRDSQTGSAALSRWPEKTVTRMAEVSKQLWRVTLVTGLLGFFLLLAGLPLAREQNKSTQAGLLLIGLFLAAWTGFHYLMAVASDRWAVQIIPYVALLAGGGLAEIAASLRLLFGRAPNALGKPKQACP